jgi:Tol biopolymer transport system component
VFGRSLGELWSAFADETRRRAPEARLTATQLTHHGFTVTSPRFGRDGRLYYSTVNPHGFPALMSIDPAAGGPRHETTRYLGERIGVAGSLLVFDELATVANVALQGDLHAFDTVTGQRTRLTSGARAGDPDVSPDGRTLAFTQQRDDRRDLVLATLETSPRPAAGSFSTLLSSVGTEFNAPRWSPDGVTIAVERHVLGALPEIVLVDTRSRAVRVIPSSAGTRSVTPAWMPDGARLLFAASRAGEPFRVFSIDLATGMLARLEGTGVSAQAPAVSEDGRTLAYVGYTAAGYDLFTTPVAEAIWTKGGRRR